MFSLRLSHILGCTNKDNLLSFPLSPDTFKSMLRKHFNLPLCKVLTDWQPHSYRSTHTTFSPLTSVHSYNDLMGICLFASIAVGSHSPFSSAASMPQLDVRNLKDFGSYHPAVAHREHAPITVGRETVLPKQTIIGSSRLFVPFYFFYFLLLPHGINFYL